MNNKISVEYFLRHPVFHYADIYSTSKGNQHEVSTCTIMDIVNIVNWLNPNEVVIIGELTATCLTESFIENLHSKNVSCLISKKKFKNNFNESIIQQLHKLDIPLILVTDNYAWSAIIKAFQDSQFKLYDRKLDTQEKFYDNAISTFNKPGVSLGTMFYKDTGASLAITDIKYNLISSSNNLDWSNIIQSITSLEVNENVKSSKFPHVLHVLATPNNNSTDVWIHPIYYKQKLIYYILLILPNSAKFIPEKYAAKIKMITRIIINKSELQQDLLSEHLLRLNELFQILLNNNFQNKEELVVLHRLAGIPLHNTIQVLVFANKTSITSIWDNSSIKIQATLNHLINQKFTGITIYNNETWFVLTDTSKSVLEKQIPIILSKLDKQYPQYYFQAGVSPKYTNNNLNRCIKEAVGALQYLKNNHFNTNLKYYSQLGIDQLFLDDNFSINSYYVDNMIETFIQPIIDHDLKYHTDLLKTLDCFIHNNFSNTTTSTELFIHKNTLRNRISSIKKLIVDDYDDLWLNIQISYHLYQHGFNKVN